MEGCALLPNGATLPSIGCWVSQRKRRAAVLFSFHRGRGLVHASPAGVVTPSFYIRGAGCCPKNVLGRTKMIFFSFMQRGEKQPPLFGASSVVEKPYILCEKISWPQEFLSRKKDTPLWKRLFCLKSPLEGKFFKFFFGPKV